MSRRPLSPHAIQVLRAIAATPTGYGKWWSPHERWRFKTVTDRFGTFEFMLLGMISAAAIRALDARGFVEHPSPGAGRWDRRILPAGKAWLDANLDCAVVKGTA